MKHKILVIDDDELICELVRIALEAEGFTVDYALNGREGLEKIYSGDYGAVVLDIMLPEVDGWEVCRQIRSSDQSAVPIIMLTARGEEFDRVLGLELGADDYVTKPFSPRELVARVKAIIRRSDEYNLDLRTSRRNLLIIEPAAHSARIGNQEIDLTPKELALLILLSENPGKIYTRDELLEEVWGFGDASNTRTVDEHIKRLRAKIAQYDPDANYIHTVWGTGYKFEVR